MRPIFFALALAATAALLWQSATPAQACSVGPDYNLVRDADIIVGGRFTGFRLADGVKLPASFYDAVDSNLPEYFVPVVVHMDVDRVFKGKAPGEIDIYDSQSLDVYDHEPRYVWVGASGACGAFSFDPTGTYAIMGVSPRSDGYYSSFIFGWLYSGMEPAGPEFEAAVARIKAGLYEPPRLRIAIAAVAVPVLFLLAASFVFPAKGSRA